MNDVKAIIKQNTIRACLNHQLIAIRSPRIRNDHAWLGTSLITIIYIVGLGHLGHLLYKVGLTTNQQCLLRLLHATLQRENVSCRIISSQCCGGDQGVPECMEQQ